MTDTETFKEKLNRDDEFLLELGKFHMIYSAIRFYFETILFKMLSDTRIRNADYIRWIVHKLSMDEQLNLLESMSKDLCKIIPKGNDEGIASLNFLIKKMREFKDKRNQYSHRFFTVNDKEQFGMLYWSGKQGVSFKKEALTIDELRKVNVEMADVFNQLCDVIRSLPKSPKQ